MAETSSTGVPVVRLGVNLSPAVAERITKAATDERLSITEATRRAFSLWFAVRDVELDGGTVVARDGNGRERYLVVLNASGEPPKPLPARWRAMFEAPTDGTPVELLISVPDDERPTAAWSQAQGMWDAGADSYPEDAPLAWRHACQEAPRG